MIAELMRHLRQLRIADRARLGAQWATHRTRRWLNVVQERWIEPLELNDRLQTVRARMSDIAAGLEQRGLRPPNRSLGTWIVLLNLVGLLILVGAILCFSPYQAWLINSKKESLLGQGSIIAAMVANSSLTPPGRISFNPDLLEPEKNEQLRAAAKQLGSLKLPFRTDKIAPLLVQVLDGTGMRARIYSVSGDLIIDSDELFGIRNPTEIIPENEIGQPISNFWTRFSDWLDGSDLPVYRDIGSARGTLYPEVVAALGGVTTPLVLMNERGRRMVGIAVPIERAGAMLGAVVLSTREGEIDKLVWRERRAILWLAGFGLLGMAISSILLSQTIAKPLRELSRAAERVQSNLKRREELPDLSNRSDEIGDLSQTLRSMTNTLYQRIEASERFAADVAHELKNPLCSVRSAAETLPLVKNEEDRRHLTQMIEEDVKRLTRLIDDISKATRVVADMAFNETQPVDVADVLKTVVDIGNEVHVRDQQKIVLHFAPAQFVDPFMVEGHDLRLGQVFKNLVDNALSFSPAAGEIRIHANRAADKIVITIEDDGPGIPPGNFERIFLRFYTDRPAASFGNNSGLGLSICKEIVEAHHGRIWAENRMENVVHRSGSSDLGVVDSRTLGARFTVELPPRSMVALAKGPRQRGQATR
jgi:two-component system, OmpR family, sensor histidine kinase ChvG